jgi:hypothetical protein
MAPIRSQKQRALMHGIASGSIPVRKSGPSKAVAKEFVESDKPGKLPKHVKPPKKGKR